MAKQLVPDVAEFRVIYSYSQAAGQAPIDMMNSIYLRNTAFPWTLAQLASFTANIYGWLNSSKALWTPQLKVIRIDAEDLGADPGARLETPVDVPTGGMAGTNVGPRLTTMAALLEAITGDAGALPKRGRRFWPWGSEGDIDGNFWFDEFRGAAQSRISAMPAEIAQGAAALVLVSRVLNGVRRATGVSNTYSSQIVRSLVAAQRDRRT